MKFAAGVLAAAVLFVAGVLIGTGRGTSSSPAPRTVELGRAPMTFPPTTAAPTTAAPTTAAPPRTTPPTTAAPPTTAPRPPETVQRRVEYGGLDDYGGNSGKGSSNSGSGSSGSSGSGTSP